MPAPKRVDNNEYHQMTVPEGAERQVGMSFFKEGLHGFIYIWRDEWVRYRGLTKKAFDKAPISQVTFSSPRRVNTHRITRI